MEPKHSSEFSQKPATEHCMEKFNSVHTRPYGFKIHFYSILASASSLSNRLIPLGLLVKFFRTINFSCLGYLLYVLLHLVDNSTNTTLMRELK